MWLACKDGRRNQKDLAGAVVVFPMADNRKPLIPNSNTRSDCPICGRVGQAQTSLNDQLREVMKMANRAGFYDAADWLRARLESCGRDGV